VVVAAAQGKNASQRRRIYEVGVLKYVRPATEHVLEINFVLCSSINWNGRLNDAAQ